MSLLLIGLLITSGHFVIHYQRLFKGSSIDLRNRMVGARVALLHKDPYTYVWKKGEPEELIDPLVYPSANFSRLTVTPAILLTHIPISSLKFSISVIWWYFLQWILLVISAVLFILMADNTYKKLGIIFVTFLFAVSSIWSAHLWFSQIYVIYTFLISCFSYSVFRKNYKFAFGVLALLVLMRPTFIFVFYAFWAPKKVRVDVKYFFFSFLFLLLTTFILFNPNIWMQYLKGMQGLGNTDPRIAIRGFDPASTYPMIIEGWVVNPTTFRIALDIENSFRGLFLSLANLYLPSWFWYTLTLAIYSTAAYILKKFKLTKPMVVLTFAVFVSIFSDYFIPARRFIYADIQWFVSIALLIIILNRNYVIKIKKTWNSRS